MEEENHISTVCEEIKVHILSFLDGVSLTRMREVSHDWKRLGDDEILWRQLCLAQNTCWEPGFSVDDLYYAAKRIGSWKTVFIQRFCCLVGVRCSLCYSRDVQVHFCVALALCGTCQKAEFLSQTTCKKQYLLTATEIRKAITDLKIRHIQTENALYLCKSDVYAIAIQKAGGEAEYMAAMSKRRKASVKRAESARVSYQNNKRVLEEALAEQGLQMPTDQTSDFETVDSYCRLMKRRKVDIQDVIVKLKKSRIQEILFERLRAVNSSTNTRLISMIRTMLETVYISEEATPEKLAEDCFHTIVEQKKEQESRRSSVISELQSRGYDISYDEDQGNWLGPANNGISFAWEIETYVSDGNNRAQIIERVIKRFQDMEDVNFRKRLLSTALDERGIEVPRELIVVICNPYWRFVGQGESTLEATVASIEKKLNSVRQKLALIEVAAQQQGLRLLGGQEDILHMMTSHGASSLTVEEITEKLSQQHQQREARRKQELKREVRRRNIKNYIQSIGCEMSKYHTFDLIKDFIHGQFVEELLPRHLISIILQLNHAREKLARPHNLTPDELRLSLLNLLITFHMQHYRPQRYSIVSLADRWYVFAKGLFREASQGKRLSDVLRESKDLFLVDNGEVALIDSSVDACLRYLNAATSEYHK